MYNNQSVNMDMHYETLLSISNYIKLPVFTNYFQLKFIFIFCQKFLPLLGRVAALASTMALVWKATRNGAVQSENKDLDWFKGGIESGGFNHTFAPALCCEHLQCRSIKRCLNRQRSVLYSGILNKQGWLNW